MLSLQIVLDRLEFYLLGDHSFGDEHQYVSLMFRTVRRSSQEIAIDLGTANTLIIHNDEVVVNEPSIVALNRNNPKEVLAVGKRALMMHEKTHESIKTVRPLKDGVIADFNAAELMLREMIKMVYPKKPLFPPSWRMMICIPSSITEVEKRAVRDSAEQAGAKEVYLIHEPMAAALGIGIDVEEPVGNMIIDIGGGTTGITVIALAGIVCDQSIREVRKHPPVDASPPSKRSKRWMPIFLEDDDAGLGEPSPQNGPHGCHAVLYSQDYVRSRPQHDLLPDRGADPP